MGFAIGRDEKYLWDSFIIYYPLRTFEWKIVMGFATLVWKMAVKFVTLHFHLASDVGKRWLGHALSEISRRWQLLKHVPSAQSDPTRNKHKDHVVPARYGIICKCVYEGKKKEIRPNFGSIWPFLNVFSTGLFCLSQLKILSESCQ